MLRFSSGICDTLIGWFGAGGAGENQPKVKYTPVGGWTFGAGAYTYTPAPTFGSSEQLLGQDTLKLSRNYCSNIVNHGQIYYKFDWTFVGLTERWAEELFDFFESGLGLAFTMLDHRGDSWTCISTTVPEFIQTADEFYSFVLEAEGF